MKTGPAYHPISFGAANILSCSENGFVHIIGAAYASGTVRTWNYDTGEILSTIRYSFIHSMYVLHTYVLRTKVHMYDQLIRAIVKIHRDQGEVLALSFNPHIQILATGGMCLDISYSLIWNQFYFIDFQSHLLLLDLETISPSIAFHQSYDRNYQERAMER